MSNPEQCRKIAKNTAIIGGAQVVQMLATLVRTKIIAVILGPFGMGINSLIFSAITIIQQFSSLGVFQSGIRDLSQVYISGDKVKMAKMRIIFNRLTIVCGILGVIVCILLSPFLSFYSFGDYSYVWSFIVVSLTLLFMAMQSGKIVIMQSTQNLRLIAKSTMVGTIMNLVISVPLFYFLGIKGIVPALVCGYMIFWLVNRYFESKIVFLPVPVPTRDETIDGSKPIVKLGWVLMVSNLLMVTFTFLLNGFISNFGSVDEVGLFQSASSICIQSLVVINSTLTADYYPRLSTVYDDNDKIKEIVNSQTEIMFYLVGVISALLIVLAPVVVRLLLSEKFISVTPLLQLMSLALIFRVLWVILGMTILAKGDKKKYFIYDAVIGHGMCFLLNIASYYFFGLYGLGYSYIVNALIMVIILSSVNQRKFNIVLTINNKKLFMVFVVLLMLSYLSFEYVNSIYGIIVSVFIAIVMSVYSIFQLNKRLELKKMIFSKFKKQV